MDNEFVSKLKQFVREAGTQTAAADRLHISKSYLGELLKGKKNNPDERILRALGLRRVKVYEHDK